MPCNPHVTLIPLLIRHNREGWEYYPPQLNFISAMVCERRSLNEGTPEGIVPLWLHLTFSKAFSRRANAECERAKYCGDAT